MNPWAPWIQRWFDVFSTLLLHDIRRCFARMIWTMKARQPSISIYDQFSWGCVLFFRNACPLEKLHMWRRRTNTHCTKCWIINRWISWSTSHKSQSLFFFHHFPLINFCFLIASNNIILPSSQIFFLSSSSILYSFPIDKQIFSKSNFVFATCIYEHCVVSSSWIQRGNFSFHHFLKTSMKIGVLGIYCSESTRYSEQIDITTKMQVASCCQCETSSLHFLLGL